MANNFEQDERFSPKAENLLMGTVCLLIALGIYNHRNSQWLQKAGSWCFPEAEISVPPEQQIARVRDDLASLIPRLHTHIQVVENLEHEFRHNQSELARLKGDLDSERNHLLVLRADLKNRNGQFTIASRPASESEVRNELKLKFENYLKSRSVFDVRLEVFTTKENYLQSARQGLSALIAKKKSLDLELDCIEAKLQLKDVGKTNVDFAADESELEKFREIIRRTRERVEKVVDKDHKGVVVPEKNLEKVIDLYFSSRLEGESSDYVLGSSIDSPID